MMPRANDQGTNMNARLMIAPVAVAVSLGVAACGGSDDDKKLSKSDLAKKANAICKPAKAKRAAVPEPPDFLENPVAAAAYLDKVVPITQKETDDLAKLKPNDDSKAAWTQFVDRQKQLNGVLITMRQKAKAKDPSGVDDFHKGERVGQKMETEAAAVDATECAQG
jgi:hypothetical protein